MLLELQVDTSLMHATPSNIQTTKTIRARVNKIAAVLYKLLEDLLFTVKGFCVSYQLTALPSLQLSHLQEFRSIPIFIRRE